MKTTLTLIISMLFVCNFSIAQATFDIPVKECHTTGSAFHDTLIYVTVGDTVQASNYTSGAAEFSYYSNVMPTPTLTPGIPPGGVIHKWKISSTGYHHVVVEQSPSQTFGRMVYLTVSNSIDESAGVFMGYHFYPSPATDHVTINAGETVKTVELLSVTGQVVDEFMPEYNSGHITYHLPPVKGCYCLRINQKPAKLIVIK